MLVFRGVALAILFAITCTAVAQNEGDSLGRDVPLIWQPPTLDFPDAGPEPTVPTMMITSLRLANMEITLEETTLGSVEKRFGGDMGQSGDASEALQWLAALGERVSLVAFHRTFRSRGNPLNDSDRAYRPLGVLDHQRILLRRSPVTCVSRLPQ